MGDEYKCNNNPQQLYHRRYSSFHQRTTAATTFLLPMLCRLSIKDVKVVKQYKDRSPSSISKDPSSPKVSCIGQVKRRNGKIHVGFPFPTPHNLFISSSKNHTKLKRFFSGKNLNTAAAAAAGDGEYSCSRELLRRGNRSAREVKSDVGVKVISELDPPLPVVKQPPPGGHVKSLWSRRSGSGASLKTLEIHYTNYLPNNNQIIPPTTL